MMKLNQQGKRAALAAAALIVLAGPTLSDQSGAWGRGSPVATAGCHRHPAAPTEPTGETPNKPHGNIQKDIPMPCLPTLWERSYTYSIKNYGL